MSTNGEPEHRLPPRNRAEWLAEAREILRRTGGTSSTSKASSTSGPATAELAEEVLPVTQVGQGNWVWVDDAEGWVRVTSVVVEDNTITLGFRDQRGQECAVDVAAGGSAFVRRDRLPTRRRGRGSSSATP